MRKVAIVLIPLLILVLVIGGVGCDKEGTSTVTPTPEPEPTIPPDFTTYTDELQLFSISYPRSWENLLWAMEGVEEWAKDIVESIESGLPLEQVTAVFAAGLPMDGRYSPNMNIVVEPLAEEKWTLNEAVEASILAMKHLYEEYHEYSRVRTRIGGREVVIVEYEMYIPGIEGHNLVMLMVHGNTVWSVTCVAETERFRDFEDTFYDIVGSFRILK